MALSPRPFLRSLLPALLAGGFLHAQGTNALSAPPASGNRPSDRPRLEAKAPGESLSRMLGITDETKKAALSRLLDARLLDRARERAEIERLHAEKKVLLLAANLDVDAFKKNAEAFGKAKTEAEWRDAQFLIEAKKQLTPEQWTRFAMVVSRKGDGHGAPWMRGKGRGEGPCDRR